MMIHALMLSLVHGFHGNMQKVHSYVLHVQVMYLCL